LEGVGRKVYVIINYQGIVARERGCCVPPLRWVRVGVCGAVDGGPRVKGKWGHV